MQQRKRKNGDTVEMEKTNKRNNDFTVRAPNQFILHSLIQAFIIKYTIIKSFSYYC